MVKIHESHHSLSHKHQGLTHGGPPGQIARKTHVTHDFMTLPNGSANLSDLTISRRRWFPSPRKAVEIQHRKEPPPPTPRVGLV